MPAGASVSAQRLSTRPRSAWSPSAAAARRHANPTARSGASQHLQRVEHRHVEERRRIAVEQEVHDEQGDRQGHKHGTNAAGDVHPPMWPERPSLRSASSQRAGHEDQYRSERGHRRPRTSGDAADLPVNLGSDQRGEHPESSRMERCEQHAEHVVANPQERVVDAERHGPRRPAVAAQRVGHLDDRQAEHDCEGRQDQDAQGVELRPTLSLGSPGRRSERRDHEDECHRQLPVREPVADLQ